MKTQTANRFFAASFAAALLALSPGCSTVNSREAKAQEREDIMLLQEKVQKLDGNVEGLQMQVQRLESDLDTLRSGQARNSQSQGQATQSALDDFDRRIRLLESAREKDRQDIINTLSAKISELLKASAPAPAARPQKGAKKTSSSGSETGYEHEVKPGETLSDIATAYGVKVSTIIEKNNLTNPNQLRVGQKLFIPEQ